MKLERRQRHVVGQREVVGVGRRGAARLGYPTRGAPGTGLPPDVAGPRGGEA
jgi:hypothetical protein